MIYTRYGAIDSAPDAVKHHNKGDAPLNYEAKHRPDTQIGLLNNGELKLL